jgi:hypothetical protein
VADSCRNKCIEMGYAPGTAEFQACLRECRRNQPDNEGDNGTEGKKTAGSPCKGEGYKPPTMYDEKTGKHIQLGQCRPGYKSVRAADGTPWCCYLWDESEEEEGTNGDNGDGEGEGEIGPGCYKLSDNPIAPEGGSIWTDEYITPEMGFMRNPSAQAEWIYKDGKWYNQGDVHNAIKNGTLDNLTGTEGYACQKFYKRVNKDGEVYCCPDESQKTTTGTGTGEFQWPQELRDAIRAMLGRYEEILNRPFGLTDEERQAIINRATTELRKGERGRLQSLKDMLARTGMTGQPYEIEKIQEEKRATGERVADVESTLAIDEIDRAIKDFMMTTGSAANILQLLMQSEQIPEVLSSARRKEGMDYMSMLLQYIAMLNGGGQNAYWQALLNYMNQSQGGGSIWDWLPYLGYYAGNQI